MKVIVRYRFKMRFAPTFLSILFLLFRAQSFAQLPTMTGYIGIPAGTQGFVTQILRAADGSYIRVQSNEKDSQGNALQGIPFYVKVPPSGINFTRNTTPISSGSLCVTDGDATCMANFTQPVRATTIEPYSSTSGVVQKIEYANGQAQNTTPNARPCPENTDFNGQATTFAKEQQGQYPKSLSCSYKFEVGVCRMENGLFDSIEVGPFGEGLHWHFSAPDNARQNTAIEIEDVKNSQDFSKTNRIHIVLIPRTNLPRYQVNGDKITMTLTTGETAIFDKKSETFISGPFQKVGNSYRYNGQALSIELTEAHLTPSTDSRTSSKMATIRQNDKTCQVPANSVWENASAGFVNFKFSSDDAAKAKINSLCHW